MHDRVLEEVWARGRDAWNGPADAAGGSPQVREMRVRGGGGPMAGELENRPNGYGVNLDDNLTPSLDSSSSSSVCPSATADTTTTIVPFLELALLCCCCSYLHGGCCGEGLTTSVSPRK